MWVGYREGKSTEEYFIRKVSRTPPAFLLFHPPLPFHHPVPSLKVPSLRSIVSPIQALTTWA